MVEPLLQVLEDDVSMKCLGREENFRKFERYFLNQISQKGYHAVLQSYPDDRAGYLHGLIHIGLALEFRQPLLLAEGLAQAAVHHYMYKKYLSEAGGLPTKKVASSPSHIDRYGADRRYDQYFLQPRLQYPDPKIFKPMGHGQRSGARWNAPMQSLSCCVWQPGGESTPMISTELQQSSSMWLETSKTNSQKAHLLEYSGRVFMMTYAGMGCPPLRLDYLCSL
ncbi:uncharacterized protein ATNIH1004_003854 [Aspergillus tanneri]|uniref:Uncharacterized protein n=1 Tax=Aspergillus tanneri TaxID=1220188 RepID=A0A5M9MLU5_9EURO|nr:uncharacterized protein ATNIH1004_003854 [Aspergillus tanneri]KAA8647972.1 hypothetical protein ATNIH1004_003854 [Aspergillus tanneri]